jgi:hypothetical protein
LIQNNPKDSLPNLLKTATEQLDWISKEIIKQNLELRDLLVKVVELDKNFRQDLILLEDIPDRIHSIAEDFMDTKQ